MRQSLSYAETAPILGGLGYVPVPVPPGIDLDVRALVESADAGTPGRILAHCFGGCAWGEVLDELGRLAR
jgi:hypothetical protein